MKKADLKRWKAVKEKRYQYQNPKLLKELSVQEREMLKQCKKELTKNHSIYLTNKDYKNIWIKFKKLISDAIAEGHVSVPMLHLILYWKKYGGQFARLQVKPVEMFERFLDFINEHVEKNTLDPEIEKEIRESSVDGWFEFRR